MTTVTTKTIYDCISILEVENSNDDIVGYEITLESGKKIRVPVTNVRSHNGDTGRANISSVVKNSGIINSLRKEEFCESENDLAYVDYTKESP